MKIQFNSSKDSNDMLILNSKINNVESVIGNKTDETIDELFDSR